jgi:hypothetical protein
VQKSTPQAHVLKQLQPLQNFLRFFSNINYNVSTIPTIKQVQTTITVSTFKKFEERPKRCTKIAKYILKLNITQENTVSDISLMADFVKK